MNVIDGSCFAFNRAGLHGNLTPGGRYEHFGKGYQHHPEEHEF